MVNVSLQSIKIGVAPRYFTGLTAAINVSVGTITSLSVSTPLTCKAKCKPAVPLWQATADSTFK